MDMSTIYCSSIGQLSYIGELSDTLMKENP